MQTCDDSSSGLLVKGEIAEELGFHQMAIGYQDLTIERFKQGVREMIKTGEASGTLLLLDTLKKFTDVMSKSESSEFGQLMREFTAVGGTVLGLAHTNKNRDRQGNLVHDPCQSDLGREPLAREAVTQTSSHLGPVQ
jgi:hypothetical protein